MPYETSAVVRRKPQWSHVAGGVCRLPGHGGSCEAAARSLGWEVDVFGEPNLTLEVRRVRGELWSKRTLARAYRNRHVGAEALCVLRWSSECEDAIA